MLTPQDIKEKKFEKATFGGYDMSLVDDFLERLHEDYSTLYKESAILKSKLKVLVEKVEEYRTTEDSMRMALVTAQKMGAEITEEAKKKGDLILSEVNEQAKRQSAAFRQQLAVEEERLAEAKRQTSAFSKKVLTLLADEKKFIEGLSELVISAPANAAAPAPPQSPPPVPPAAQQVLTPPMSAAPIAPVVPPTTPPPPPPQAPAAEPASAPEQIEASVEDYLARAVSEMMADPTPAAAEQVPAKADPFVFVEAKLEGKPKDPFFDDETAPVPPTAPYTQEAGAAEVEFYKLFDQDPAAPVTTEEKLQVMSILEEKSEPAPALAEAEAAQPVDARAAEKIDIARSISASLGDTEEIKVDTDAFWDDEGQPTTKRPKFDFDNLQFGINYDEE